MDFLFEIGLEEVPARMIASAEAELRRRVVAMLERERLVATGVASKSFSTPRRLAVWVADVAARQQDVAEEMVGPAVKTAFKDGKPGPAAVAFAKKAGVDVAALKTVTTAKGEYIAATSVKAGRAAAEVIAEELPKALAGIYWAKNMVWRAGRPERFVRPVRWLVCLLGEVVVPVEFGGKTAGKATRGHRVLAGDEAIPIGFPDEYEQVLLKAHVVADVEKRRLVVRKALDRVTRAAGGDSALRWRVDEALVDTVTHLTEWPTVVLGSFEPEYLTAAGRGAGDGDARSSEVFCGGRFRRQTRAALSCGAEYGGGCGGRGGDSARERARAEGAVQRCAIFLGVRPESAAEGAGSEAREGDVPERTLVAMRRRRGECGRLPRRWPG